ncbi:MAG: DUF1189 family protein [bacterium]
MKKLSTFWYSFQKSLLDFTYYKDIAKASYWFSFKYLFLLLVCLSLVRSVQLGVLYTTVRKNIPSYISSVQKELVVLYPKELELRISNGNLYTNVQEPYTIEFPKIFGDMEGKHMVVIDTKGIADNYPKYNTVVLVTKQTLVFPEKQQGSRTTTQMYYFSDLKKSVYMDYSEYSKIIKNLNPFIAKLPKLIDVSVVVGLALLPLFGGLFWLSSTLFGLIFLTLGVWLIEKIVKTSYGYKTLFRMGMHAATWGILFTFLLDITNQNVPYLYNLIFIAWMTFVLIKNREPKIVV